MRQKPPYCYAGMESISIEQNAGEWQVHIETVHTQSHSQHIHGKQHIYEKTVIVNSMYSYE